MTQDELLAIICVQLNKERIKAKDIRAMERLWIWTICASPGQIEKLNIECITEDGPKVTDFLEEEDIVPLVEKIKRFRIHGFLFPPKIEWLD